MWWRVLEPNGALFLETTDEAEARAALALVEHGNLVWTPEKTQPVTTWEEVE